jgi:hypothetical protein
MTAAFFGSFLRALQKKERHCYFMQDGAAAPRLKYTKP